MNEEVTQNPNLPEDAVNEEDMSEVSSNRKVATSEEVLILRAELEKTQVALANTQSEAEEYKQKHLRALAEVQTVRRRLEQEITLAKEQGASSIILAALPVYDDLRRALEVANEDPSKIIPGVEQVRETLKRNFENLGIKEVGLVGEAFDPNYHEALNALPAENEKQKGTIAQIFESGFVKDDKVVRFARVIVFK